MHAFTGGAFLLLLLWLNAIGRYVLVTYLAKFFERLWYFWWLLWENTSDVNVKTTSKLEIICYLKRENETFCQESFLKNYEYLCYYYYLKKFSNCIRNYLMELENFLENRSGSLNFKYRYTCTSYYIYLMIFYFLLVILF